MRDWMLESAIIDEDGITELESTAKKYVRDCQREVWNELAEEIKTELDEAVQLIETLASASDFETELKPIAQTLLACVDPGRKDSVSAIRRALLLTATEQSHERSMLVDWLASENKKNKQRFSS